MSPFIWTILYQFRNYQAPIISIFLGAPWPPSCSSLVAGIELKKCRVKYESEIRYQPLSCPMIVTLQCAVDMVPVDSKP